MINARELLNESEMHDLEIHSEIMIPQLDRIMRKKRETNKSMVLYAKCKIRMKIDIVKLFR